MNKPSFVPLYRKIYTRSWAKHVATLCLYIYLLTHASFKELLTSRGRLLAGQLFCSLSFLAENTGLTIYQVRGALKRLEEDNMISVMTSQGCRDTVITVLELSPEDSEHCQEQEDRQCVRQSLDDVPVSIDNGYATTSECAEQCEKQCEKQIIIKETIKKNGKRENTISKMDDLFDRFWKVYPRRVAKATARKAFEKIKPDESLLNIMIHAIQCQRETDQWKKQSGQFIPHPATWLNQQRWEDELPTTIRFDTEETEPTVFFDDEEV